MAEHTWFPMAEYVDRPAAIRLLHAAQCRLREAALALNEIENGQRLAGEMSFLVGGLSQTVESLTGLLDPDYAVAVIEGRADPAVQEDS